jgi:hypothetical protein
VRFVENAKLFVAFKFSLGRMEKYLMLGQDIIGANKKLYYHQRSSEYIIRTFKELCIDLPIDPCQTSNNKSIE